MVVFIKKQWAGYKPGEQAEITDPAVLKKGFEVGLFSKEAEAAKEMPVVKTPEIKEPKKSKK